ncbi:MAG: sulfatase-like hydrolase/transferase [Flavobacteriaceae bacterium]|nr:sulfatase-like hydrolase/transferase [Flavobacteriaceae bacterium]
MRELRTHFIISGLLTLIFILPDVSYNLLYDGYFDLSINIYREFLIFFAINFLILSVPNLYLKFFLYSIFIFFILVEHLHYSFFHSLIMPYEINMFIDQPEEVFESLFGIVKYILIELLSLTVLLFVAFFIFKYSSKSTLRIKYISLFFIFFIFFTGTLIASQSRIPNLFYPKNDSTSIRNFYTSFSWWLGKDIITSFGNSAPQKKFQQYKLNHIKIDSPNTIIVVMGESLGAKYMSLYGFSKKTTPKLDKLKSNLLYTWGYSGGVETKVSVPTFLHLSESQRIRL